MGCSIVKYTVMLKTGMAIDIKAFGKCVATLSKQVLQ